MFRTNNFNHFFLSVFFSLCVCVFELAFFHAVGFSPIWRKFMFNANRFANVELAWMESAKRRIFAVGINISTIFLFSLLQFSLPPIYVCVCMCLWLDEGIDIYVDMQRLKIWNVCVKVQVMKVIYNQYKAIILHVSNIPSRNWKFHENVENSENRRARTFITKVLSCLLL